MSNRQWGPYVPSRLLSEEDLEKRRAEGRERSRRYYERQKSMYGKTHRNRGDKPPTMGVCNHECGCQMVLVPPPVCGMCLEGLCEHG